MTGGDTAAMPGVRARASCSAVVSAPVTKDGLVYVQGTLTSQPVSQAAFTTVDRVRAAVHQIPGADAKVGGGTAVTMDVESYATRDRNVIIPLVLLVVLVLGASTDYALLLIARYREELRRHEDRHEAMAVALRRAGPAIIASGATAMASCRSVCLRSSSR